MNFPDPLVKATLIKRYKRFLADVRFEDGTETTAHIANPGGMIGLKDPGMTIWLSPARNPARKLKWSWEIAEADGGMVGVSTAHPNAIAEGSVGTRRPSTEVTKSGAGGQTSVDGKAVFGCAGLLICSSRAPS